MDIEQLEDDVRTGRIMPDRLVELLVTLQRELQAASQELDAAKGQIEDLKRQLGSVPGQKVSQPVSVRAGVVLRRTQGCGDAAADSRSGDVEF